MTRRIRFGESTDIIALAAQTQFAWPTDKNSAGKLDLTPWTSGRTRPPDVIIRLKASAACSLAGQDNSTAVGLVGQAPDDTLSLIEGPLFEGGQITFVDSNIAREFAVAVGGYVGLWLVAFSGARLDVSGGKQVVFSAIPAYSTEG